jgi:hypothetical protein
MILFHCKVYSWIDERDSTKRVSKSDHPSSDGTVHHREYVINPNFMTDITTNSTYGSNLKYSDNFYNRREKYSSLIIDKTPAQIKTYMDSTPNSNTIALLIHPNNNPDKTAVSTTIQWSNIILADRYNPSPDNHCWVKYLQGAFKIKEVLVNQNIEDIVRLVRSGNETATFTSVHNFFSVNYEKTNTIS